MLPRTDVAGGGGDLGDDDENGGFGLNNGQETPTGRPLSLSRVKAEVAYSAACCTYTGTQATNAPGVS